MKCTYYAFLPVRNSEKSIGRVMESLLNQTYPPEKIVVVDDGSTDATGDILKQFQNKDKRVKLLRTESTTTDYTRMATLFNMCLHKQYDYHLQSGGDTVFESDYAETILQELEKDPTIAMASGRIGDESLHFPHGGGRFVRQDYFFRFYDKYPEAVGHETEIVYKAMVNGYKAKVFKDVIYEHTAATGHQHNFTEYGPTMKAMGFHPAYVLGKAILELVKNQNTGRRAACQIFWQYLTFKPTGGYWTYYPEKDRQNVRDFQRRQMIQKIGKFFRLSR